MEEVKLPDLSRVRDARRRSKKLPPQESATDTSNWEDRAFSAPNTERQFEMIPPLAEDVVVNPLLEQERIKAEARSKKTKKH